MRETSQQIFSFLAEKTYLSISIIAALILLVISYLFTDFATLQGNRGTAFLIIEIATSIIVALLFGLNVGLIAYKRHLAASVRADAHGSTILGSLFGIIVTGCPSCSITIASYLGLASVISLLPFSGLELKIVGIGLLVYSTYQLLASKNSCKVTN